MLGINGFLNKWAYNRTVNNTAFNKSNYTSPLGTIYFKDDLPGWVALNCPEHYEQAYRFNPIVKATINLIAASSSNGNKYLVDSVSGERIEWTDKSDVVQKIKKLLIVRPNPIQSGKEFDFQGIAYLKTFGNRYVNNVMPVGFDRELDIMNIDALWNLPSQFIQVKTTGKLYNQTKLEDIISEYARTNTTPIEKYTPNQIMHFNEVNISSEQASVMGISKLEVLRDPITNTQAAFQAMKSLLTTRGMSGIITPKKTDGTGGVIPLSPKEKKEVDEKFKNNYGLLNDQNPFLISPVPLDYLKTVMNSKDLGIYEEFSNNSILISNEFNVPPELVKTYIQGATYENQEQSVKRLYQDSTIPQVAEYDQYANYSYNLDKYGVELRTDWSHIPALANNKKDEATTNSLNSKVALAEYDNNLITFDQYLTATGKQTVGGTEGAKYKYQRNINNDNQ